MARLEVAHYLFAQVTCVASGNSFLLWTFDQILKARRDHKFDGYRENGAVARLQTHNGSQKMTAAASAMAERKRSPQRVHRVAMPRQSFSRAKAFSIRQRFL